MPFSIYVFGIGDDGRVMYSYSHKASSINELHQGYMSHFGNIKSFKKGMESRYVITVYGLPEIPKHLVSEKDMDFFKRCADAGLTCTETNVLFLYRSKMRTYGVAFALGISENTVKAHAAHIRRKTGCGSIEQAWRKMDGEEIHCHGQLSLHSFPQFTMLFTFFGSLLSLQKLADFEDLVAFFC